MTFSVCAHVSVLMTCSVRSLCFCSLLTVYGVDERPGGREGRVGGDVHPAEGGHCSRDRSSPRSPLSDEPECLEW